MRTRIDGGWVVGFDGSGHVLHRRGCVVVEGNRIAHVGAREGVAADRVIGSDSDLVTPGFINAHVHASSQAAEWMIADCGRHDTYNTGFLNYLPAKGRGPGRVSLVDPESPEVGGAYCIVNLLRSGCTTMVEIGGELGGVGGIERFADLCGRIGIRSYLSPGYGAASWYYDDDNHLVRSWDEDAGLAALDRACGFIESWHGRFDGLIQGMLFPVEVATSTPLLLERTRDAADRLGVGISIHCAEAQLEWHHTVTRFGMTPVQHLDSLGLLRPGTILGHVIFIDTHSATSFPTRTDIATLARTGAAVAHCPVVFARRGFALESFDRYRQAGVTLCLGTDAFPQDMLYEMKVASLMGKVVDRSFAAGHARDIFNAATLGGAAALGRTDIGRLAPGALADIAVFNLRGHHIGAVHDPIRSLVHAAGARDVRYVLVNGAIVLSPDGIPGVDEESLLDQVQATGERIWERFADHDHAHRPLEAFATPCFPTAAAPSPTDR